jgi:hypothetical protein
MPAPVCFRLTRDDLDIIDVTASALSTDKHREVDRTEALRHIIKVFNEKHEQTNFIARIKKRLSTAATTEGQTKFNDQISEDQLEEALH